MKINQNVETILLKPNIFESFKLQMKFLISAMRWDEMIRVDGLLT